MAAIPGRARFADWLVGYKEVLSGDTNAWATIATGLMRRPRARQSWRSDMVAILLKEATGNPDAVTRQSLWTAIGPHLTTAQAIESLALLKKEPLSVMVEILGALAYHPHPEVDAALLDACRSVELVRPVAFGYARATRYDLLSHMEVLRNRVKELGEKAKYYDVEDILMAENALKTCKEKNVPIGTPQPYSRVEVQCVNLGRPTAGTPQEK